MKKLFSLAAVSVLMSASVGVAHAQVRFAPGGAAGGGGYAGGAEPLVVLPYASGVGGGPLSAPQAPMMGGPAQGQVGLAPNVIEQEEDIADQQQPSMIVSDPDDSALEQPVDVDNPAGFDGLEAIKDVDSSY